MHFPKKIRFMKYYLYNFQIIGSNRTKPIFFERGAYIRWGKMIYNIFNKSSKMQRLWTLIKSLENPKDSLRETCRSNHINIGFLCKISMSKVKKIINKLVSIYRRGSGRSANNWLENELKLFHFSLLILSSKHENIPITSFTHEHFSQLQTFFPNKSLTVIEYQAMSFIGGKNLFKNEWRNKQDQILTNLIKNVKNQEPKWNEIAVNLYKQSNKSSFRTGKQCKERWFNHLDPLIKHGQWTREEDRKLIEYVLAMGKKWCFVCKVFEGRRTEHMVKNRFLSLTLKEKRKSPHLLNETEVLRNLAKKLEGQCLSPSSSSNNIKFPEIKIEHEEEIQVKQEAHIPNQHHEEHSERNSQKKISYYPTSAYLQTGSPFSAFSNFHDAMLQYQHFYPAYYGPNCYN